jgi:hypothetical protein
MVEEKREKYKGRREKEMAKTKRDADQVKDYKTKKTMACNGRRD